MFILEYYISFSYDQPSCVWFRNIHFQRESKQRRISVMTTCLSILCIPMEGQDDDNDYGNLIQNEEHQHKD